MGGGGQKGWGGRSDFPAEFAALAGAGEAGQGILSIPVKQTPLANMQSKIE
jgi:hypothetical protein